MGIMVNAGAIFLGGLMGDIFKNRISIKNFSVLGISIMLISFVGFVENMFNITNAELKSEMLMPVVFALIIGSFIGELLHIEDRLSRFSNHEKLTHNAFIDATLFFGIGGLQISGPIILAVDNDNSQLFLKSLIDFPFAFIFGATYGKITSLSALPVALMQILIAVVAFFCGSFFNDAVISQFCAMGYMILFFSGFNLLCEKQHKINNVNMLPGIFIIFLINIGVNIWEGLL